MPFLARCYRCGYITTALTHDALEIFKDDHCSKSHSDYGTEWTTTTISEKDFYQLERLRKVPAFWKALRVSHKQKIIPFSSGQGSGEIKPF